MPNSQDKPNDIQTLQAQEKVVAKPHEKKEKFNFYCLKIKIALGNKRTSLYVIGPSLSIGREGSDVEINHSTIAKTHALLQEQDGVLLLEDCESPHGTFVNNQQLTPHRPVILEEGDQLKFGQVESVIVLKNEEDIPRLFAASRGNVSVTPVAAIAPSSFTPAPTPLASLSLSPSISIPEVGNGEVEPRKESESILEGKIKKIHEKEEKLSKQKKVVKWPLRLASLSLDLLLTEAVSYNSSSWTYYNQFKGSFLPILEKFFNILPFFHHPAEFVFSVLSFGTFYFSLQFISAFIFGVSWGQISLGIVGGEQLLWNRLGGMIRVSVDFFSWPFFFILNVPALIGKRTFKEWVTGTTFQWDGGRRTLIHFMTFVPLIGVMTLILPFILQTKEESLASLTGLPKTKNKVPGIPAPVPSVQWENSEGPLLNSHHFGFKIPKSAWVKMSAIGPIFLLPHYEIVKRDRYRRIAPLLQVYDAKTQVKGSLQVTRRDSLIHLFDQVRKRNNFFHWKYPQLDKFLNRYQRKEVVGTWPELTQEVEQLLSDSFKLNTRVGLPGMMSFLWQNGPFVHGHLFLKKSLSEMIPGQGVLKLKILTWQGRPFLELSRERNFFFKSQAEHLRAFIPLDLDNDTMMELTWEDSPETLKTHENFIKNFLQKVEWGREGVGERAKESSLLSALKEFKQREKGESGVATPSPLSTADQEYLLKNLTSLNTLDYFALMNLSFEERQLLEDVIYHSFFDLGRKITSKIIQFEKEKKTKALERLLKLQALMIGTFESFQNVTKLIYEEKAKDMAGPHWPETGIPFVLQLERLKEALMKHDQKFFEISS